MNFAYSLTFERPDGIAYTFTDLPMGTGIESRYDLDGLSMLDRAAMLALCRRMVEQIESDGKP